MDYKEKYEKALERLKQWDREHPNGYVVSERDKFIFPELTESEDERIRKALIEVFKKKLERGFEWVEYGIPNRSVLDWLEKQKDLDKMIVVSPEVWDNAISDAFENGKKEGEKQKENPKSSDSIPEDCTSDAKCEDRWHKVTDSLPDNGRLVLAKDCLGNVLLARYDGENWEVNVYDNEDHYCHNSISKWCEIPSEKQKEQKPADTNNISITPERLKELRDRSFEDGRKAGMAEMATSMPLPEDTVLFNKGVVEGRRLEREESHENYVRGYANGYKDAEKRYNESVAYNTNSGTSTLKAEE